MTTDEAQEAGAPPLTALDGPVRTLFERIAGPASAVEPDLAAIGSALVELAADLDYLAP